MTHSAGPNDGEYFAPPAPVYFIKGNNEDFDIVANAMSGRPPAPTLHYLPNGGPYDVGPWRVAALGGTFAPSWYHSPVSALPPSRGKRLSTTSMKLGKSRDDKRRHSPDPLHGGIRPGGHYRLVPTGKRPLNYDLWASAKQEWTA